jgi:hypothetical protein
VKYSILSLAALVSLFTFPKYLSIKYYHSLVGTTHAPEGGSLSIGWPESVRLLIYSFPSKYYPINPSLHPTLKYHFTPEGFAESLST